MTIEFPCNQCLQPLRVPDTSAGKSARCPKCQAITPVPAASAAGGLPAGGFQPSVPPAPETRPVYPPIAGNTQAIAAPPASNANDALFAMLKAATTPQPAALPPSVAAPFAATTGAPPAGSPFVGSQFTPSAPAPSINPYASPAEAYASQFTATSGGERPGLPWEVEGAGIVSWWKTSQMCLTDSSHAFRIMRQEGGIGSPFLFAVLGMMIGFLGQAAWRLPVLLFSIPAGGKVGQQEALMMVLVEIGGGAAVTLGIAVLLLPIYAVMYHLTLMAFGGARQGFETTYRVVAFTHGSLAWLQVVPCIGGLIVLVMHFVCLINGLAQAQETTMGKAAAAVFLPLVLCVVAAIGIAIVVVAAIAAQ